MERSSCLSTLAVMLLMMLPACGGGGGSDKEPPEDISSWICVDSTTANGINKNATRDALCPQLTVFNSRLYATWDESTGTRLQIRVAVYNGNDSVSPWSFVDGNGTNGINKDSSRDAFIPQLTVFNSKLYAT